MNAKDLELKISGLEKVIKEHDDASVTFQNDLKSTQKQLDDYNKPELKPIYFDKIQDAVEEGVGNYDFDEQDNYDKEFGMECDGKVYLESIDLTCNHELIENIVEQVHKLFKEAECPDEDVFNKE